MCEAPYEDMIGKCLVVDTILNRVDDPAFPNTVYGVVYQDNQFYKAAYYSAECMDAVEHEIYERTDYDVLWFAADGYLPYGTKAYQHGGHYFSWRTK
jgi:N-acetylmuramoyl-L-alanine amidase